LAAGDVRSCFGMTEPHPGAGSDPAALQTSAVKRGDRWVIDGHKRFISGAIGAAFCIVMARNEDGGAAMFLIDMDNPGIRVGEPIHTVDRYIDGGHLHLYLEGCEVDENAVLGEPPELDSTEQRAATADALVDTLVQLHAVDVSGGEIASFGRPDGYLSRQVERFSALWEISTTRALPEMSQIGAWLAAHVPETVAASVVQGDYRLGNVMLHTDPPARVVAVLDWEMATLGEPLADLGDLTSTFTEADTDITPLDLTVTSRSGYPTASQLAERYAGATRLDLTPLPWYQTLTLWKAAIFCQAMHSRWLRGERAGDDYAPSLKSDVPLLLERAGDALQRF
jgi:aminoglycoside phosphotransferase (APT) family kinase protein